MIALFSHALLVRLGLTVLHALWELAVLGFLVALGLALLRNRGPRAAYVWACLGLAAMVAAPMATFLALGAPPASAPESPVAMVLVEGAVTEATWNRLVPWAPLAALAWLAGVALMLARLGAGLWWLERAYLGRSEPAPEAWQACLDALAVRLGLRRAVGLRVSRSVATPLLIGWIRPVVLVPTAAFLNLSPTALEAVLAHELAHVRRGDYLANLLQTLAEAFLFFHPCAWWLSRRIRELREHCCDDAAAALCGDPLILAEGLTALERLRRNFSPIPEPALAAAKGSLMIRITRLFQPQSHTAPSVRGLALALVAASLLGAGTLALQQEAPKAERSKAAAAPAPSRETAVHEVDFSRIKVRHQPPPPPYPAEAREQRIQGTVVVDLVVDETGVPIAVKAIEGPEALRPTAIAYAQDWRFEPLKVKGKPAKARFKLTMPFRLR